MLNLINCKRNVRGLLYKIYFRNLNKCRPTWLHLLYYVNLLLNMFRTLIYPSSGACDFFCWITTLVVCSWFDVCRRFGVVGLQWYPCSRLRLCFSLQHGYTRKLLMMDILMSEACWAHKKWNKIASDIKLVLYSSTIINMLYVIWIIE